MDAHPAGHRGGALLQRPRAPGSHLRRFGQPDLPAEPAGGGGGRRRVRPADHRAARHPVRSPGGSSGEGRVRLGSSPQHRGGGRHRFNPGVPGLRHGPRAPPRGGSRPLAPPRRPPFDPRVPQPRRLLGNHPGRRSGGRQHRRPDGRPQGVVAPVDRVPHDPHQRPEVGGYRLVPNRDRRQPRDLEGLLRLPGRQRRVVHPVGGRGHRTGLPGLQRWGCAGARAPGSGLASGRGGVGPRSG